MPVLDPTLTTPTVQQPTVPDASLNSLGTPQLPYAQTSMVGLDSSSPDDDADVNTAPSMSQAPDAQNGNASGNDSTDSSDTSGSELTSNRMLGQLDANLPSDEQSTENTILGTYNARQAATQQGSQAKAQQIQNNSNEDIYYQNQENQNELTSAEESRRGFATNTALFSQMQDTGQKRIRDLEKQRDDYLLQNDQNNADQINQLIIGEQQAITTARQNYFTNQFDLLGKQQTQEQFEYGKTPTQRLNALAQVRQSLFYSGADASELNMIDQLIQQTATGGGTTSPGGGTSSTGAPAGSRALGTAGVIQGSNGESYDLSSYNPGGGSAYINSINQSVQKYGPITDAASAQAVIDKNSLSGTSPITGQMVMDAAQQSGVDPAAIMAIMENEQHFLTDPKGQSAIAANNPGSIMSGPGGTLGKYATPEAGVQAVAHWLAQHPEQGQSSTAGASGGATSTLQSLQDSYTQQLQSGTPPAQISATFAPGQYGSMQSIALSNAQTQYYKDNPTENIGKSDINYQSILDASRDVSDQAAQRLVTINKLNLATQTLQQLSDKFARTGVTVFNDKWLQSQLAINNPDAIKFDQTVKLIADDLGQVFASGGTLSDAKLQFGGSLVDKNYSAAGMKAALTNLTSLMGLQTQAYNDVLNNPSGLGTNRSLTGQNQTTSTSSSSGSTDRTLAHPVGSMVSYQGKKYIVGHNGDLLPEGS